MRKFYNNELLNNSRNLRKNMTKEERHLWYDFLKNLPVSINRQKIFQNYIVDFYCDKAKIVIEVDGSQYYEEEALEKDKIRDAYFEELGIKVLRYSNRDIWNDFSAVCEDIYNNIFNE